MIIDHAEMNVVTGVIGVAARSMPVGGRKLLQTRGQARASLLEALQQLGSGLFRQGVEFRIALRRIRSDGRVLLREQGIEPSFEDLLHPADVRENFLDGPFLRLHARRDRRLVQVGSETAHVGGLGFQTVDHGQVGGVLHGVRSSFFGFQTTPVWIRLVLEIRKMKT